MPDADFRDQIKDMMIQYLMLRTPKEEIGDETPLFGPEGLGLDSIDALELAVGLEKTFGVKVASSEVAKTAFQNVNSLNEFVNAEKARG